MKDNRRLDDQVDFATKPQFWRSLHPPIKVVNIIIINIILIVNRVQSHWCSCTSSSLWSSQSTLFQEKLGELLVSLSYHPANNTLTIAVLKVKKLPFVTESNFQNLQARNLKAKDINGKSGKSIIIARYFQFFQKALLCEFSEKLPLTSFHIIKDLSRL